MSMDSERSAAIIIGGKEYELTLTTRATKVIAGRYGGLENLGDKLMSGDNFEGALDEIIFLIVLLANQSIQIHNLWHPEEKKTLLDAETLELLTTPADLAGFKDAILAAMTRGASRAVESEDGGDGKNQPAG